jgi:hypothetical protein
LTLTAAQLLGCSAAAAPSSPKSAVPPPPTPPGSGKPGDLDFLTGEWKIKHRRLKAPGTWDEFEGEATCYSILQGIGSVEELRIPARDFSGMGLRLLDVERRVWSDFWVNAKSGVLTTPGVTGAFVDGVGTFTAPEVDASGQPILARGVWDQITPRSCRWRQGVSRDAGATWEDNWIMEWTRVK